MSQELDLVYFVKAVKNMIVMAEENRDYLSQLDSDVGDGDHGINLSIGFRDVEKKLENFDIETENISSLFKSVGMSLLGKVGGASGPLYGSFFLAFGSTLNNKKVITTDEFITAFGAAVDKVQFRGKAELNDKTMIDVLIPAKEYLFAHKESDFKDTLVEVVKLMKERSIEIKPLVAKKGRAMRLGDRAIGHFDPGAESSWRILECFLLALN
ncbi:dihydroxyacetone kinase DhaL subunit [Granulicatella balaenopterae]|uniref:phosphoenolpyruvate--glycerone phosphotransferase n=1 Tax=Granulicatella balaenopterae TaxID=137733 RepID=A0A1H9P520_9LACT|nr:dihydroxyacetone kinase subunit DhaL [Granulicatella balaenopterae]SER42673.1 dihydroxyacetone kinase DhaL subunit [Granulicatella balaenopterae]